MLGLIETWSSGNWTAQTAPMPANHDANPHAQFAAVTCGSAVFCVAAGSYVPRYSDATGLFETWSGKTWTPAPAPLQDTGNPAFPQAVACTSASACLATGYTYNASGTYALLLETLSGTRWTPTAPPLPAGVSSGITTSSGTLACTSPAFCALALGYVDKARNSEGLLMTGPD